MGEVHTHGSLLMKPNQKLGDKGLLVVDSKGQHGGDPGQAGVMWGTGEGPRKSTLLATPMLAVGSNEDQKLSLP